MKRKLSHLVMAASPAIACLTALLTTRGTGLAVAGDVPAQETVILNTAALEQLRTTNPDHYARAQRILAAAAGHLCGPGMLRAELAKLGANDVSCTPELLLTSLPPKWRMHFWLDDTHYVAYVKVGVSGNPINGDLAAGVGSDLEAELAAQRVTLAEMRQRYSEEHPDVKRVERTIQELQARLRVRPAR
jgi:hypothetical protein